jgi:hypothetical protein
MRCYYNVRRINFYPLNSSIGIFGAKKKKPILA